MAMIRPVEANQGFGRRGAVLGLALGMCLALAGAAGAQSSAPKPVKSPYPAENAPVVHDAGGPAYHARAPRGPLPPTLPPSEFSDPRVQTAYAMAAKIRRVLYEQPCYCRCDKGFGHRSLLDCYVGDHASVCETCLMEGIFAYNQTKAGKTPGQIRAEIKRGEWKNVNLNDYLTPPKY